MSSRVINWIGRIAAVMLVALELEPCHGQQPKQTLEKIHQVWKERQEKTASARFSLRSEETIYEGSTSFMVNLERRRTGRSNQLEPDNPPQDYIVQGTTEVRLSDEKLRYTLDHQQWDPNGKKLYREHYIDVFNGRIYKTLQNPASGQQDYPSASLSKAEASRPPLKYSIIPLIWTFRGRHPQFFRDLEKFKLTGQAVTLGGRPCLELIRDSRDDSGREMLYVDQERNYVVIKQMILVADKPRWQVDVTYAPDANAGWVPRSWEYIIRAGKEHRMFQSGRITVDSYVINPRMEEDEFDITFPPGTRVQDRSSEIPVQYIILENGKKGREIPHAANPTYEDLQKPPSQINRRALIITWTVIFVLALGIWIRSRLRRREPKNQDT